MIEQLFDKAPCGYLSFFEDGNFFMGNGTFYSITGYSFEELAGKNIETIFTIPTRIFYQTHFFPMLKMHGHAEEIFITLLTKEKVHLPVLLNAKCIEWEGRRLFTCAFIEVHNRKKFEDELVAARRTAETALKENSELMKARSDLQRYTEQLDEQIQLVNKQNNELVQFSHAVTHSLKEPLRKIVLYSEKLRTTDIPEIIQPAISRITKASDQLKTVVDGLQQYIWLNEAPIYFTEVDLEQLIQQSLKELDKKQSELVVHFQLNQLPHIEGDASQLKLLFQHLFQNAVKFKKGDKANVSVTGTALKRNWFRAVENKYLYQDFVKLEIRDEGIGFDVAFKDNLFQIFRKLHRVEGLGLGLALCRKIAGNHHGSIEADSRLNEFAAFTVWLPLKQISGSE